MTTTTERDRLGRAPSFVDNEWVEQGGTQTYEVAEAATGEVLGAVTLGDAGDFDRAVRSARRAFEHGEWAEATAAERAEVLARFGGALRDRAGATSELVTRENGMPIGLSRALNGAAPASLLRTYGELSGSYEFEQARASRSGSTIVRRVPVGVVGAIVAWNYPQLLAMMKIGPALAAGCTVVLKPSPQTTLDAMAIGEAAREAGLPPGVLNIVAAGPEASSALVSHPDIDKIAFTGSSATGQLIGAACGRLIRRVTLELGGKSAAIVLDDADIDTLLAGIGIASFMNNSQSCTTQSRILVPRQRYDEIVDALAEWCRQQIVGDPLDPEVTIGPMATQAHLQRVLKHIELARASDARLVVGGGRPKHLTRGWFVEPTIFADVDNRDQLAREEVFGPVMAVIPYEGDDEAVRIANDSEYGLGGSVWTTDEQRGVDIARRIRTGTVGVNYYLLDVGAPFGGMKNSGLGRELGPEAIEPYLEYQSIYASADQLPAPPLIRGEPGDSVQLGNSR